MFQIFTQYKGLRRENYILFIGKIVTNMGSMIWPVLTLILTQKLGMSAADASIYDIVIGAIALPLSLLGGKLADKYNKKRIIVFFDMISIFFYLTCAFIPLGFPSIIMLSIGSLFQTMEGPAYDTLIADISTTEQRERAYSLDYLGANIGLVASPIIAGFLFENYLWLSFLISGLAIGTSTLLIAIFVKDITPVEDTSTASVYQESVNEKVSAWSILKQNKIMFIFIIQMAMFWSAYGQWSFLLPIDIATAHGSELGAQLYGMVTSENCIIVVLFTPIITQVFSKLLQTGKMVVGTFLVSAGYLVFLVGLGFIPTYFLAIALFTFGEIFMTIVCGPYTTERIPASHRGRFNGITNILQSILSGIAMFAIGNLYTYVSPLSAWILVFVMLGIAVVTGILIVFLDKKYYPKLYETKEHPNPEH